MHKIQLLSESTSGLNYIYSICCLCSFLLITFYFLVLKTLSRILRTSYTPMYQVPGIQGIKAQLCTIGS